MHPYRGSDCTEEELYQRLDEALESAFTDPTWSWSVAFTVVRDALILGFRDVARSAQGLIDVLFPVVVTLQDRRFEDG